MFNIVYINTHDTGRMIQPYGFPVKTPVLQELAEDAQLFTQCYCSSPTCSPSRSAMLTGEYPHQNGMLGLAQRGFSLYNEEKHLASYLQKHGFQTAISGIQHEVGWYLDLEVDKVKSLGYEYVLTTDSSKYKKEDLHLWDRENVNSAIDWLGKRDKEKPFFLAMGLHSTHRPYPIDIDASIDQRYIQPSFELKNTEENRKDQAQYCTTALYADCNIGEIIDALKKNNLYDNTIILFTTDHGLALPFHKCNLNDNGLGVAFILRHPNLKKGIVVDNMVSHIDIFPTLCDCLEIEKPDYLEGVSFYAMLQDSQQSVRNEIFAEINFHTSYEPVRCVRTERYKLVRMYDREWMKVNCSNIDESIPKSFYMKNDLQKKAKVSEALYDCVYDKQEVNNLIDSPEYQEIVQMLREKLDDFMIKTNDPLLEGPLAIKKNYKVNKQECLSASSKKPEDYDPRGRF